MATRSLGTLTLDLIARIGGFEQGMDKAGRVTEKRMKELFPLQPCSASAGLISDGSTLLVVVHVLARNIDGAAADDGIRAGEIDIFKEA